MRHSLYGDGTPDPVHGSTAVRVTGEHVFGGAG